MSLLRATGTRAGARYANEVAYRCDDHVIEAARAEERELRALGHDARMRRVRVGAVLGALVALAFGGPALAARLPAAPERALHCHHVTVEYQQDVGTPPPPVSWQVCEWR